jgi:hypothetical protein
VARLSARVDHLETSLSFGSGDSKPIGNLYFDYSDVQRRIKSNKPRCKHSPDRVQWKQTSSGYGYGDFWAYECPHVRWVLE